MKILFIGEFGNTKTVETDVRPVIGDMVALFGYDSTQEVKTILLYPPEALIKIKLGVEQSYDMIVTVE